MQSSADNPARNALGAGVTNSAVMAAIDRSGYPLQTLVAERLSKAFHVREEWSYVDRDTQALRTIDIVASCPLDASRINEKRVRPQLDLIIECKKSELPFVFFATRHHPWIPNFPIVAGLNQTDIELVTDDDLSTWKLSLLHVLSLDTHPFSQHKWLSNTFSKCVRRSGGDLDLSGDEGYNSIVLPLVKAAAHFEAAERPRSTYVYFDAHLVVPIAVVDAPMVLLELVDGAPIATLKPWIRVARHEYDRDSDQWHKDRLWAIDVIHVDFLATYVEHHLMPFAKEFGSRALAHHKEMAEGKGFASGLGADSFSNLEGRLRERAVMSAAARGASIFWRLLTLPYWIWKKKK